MIISTCIFLKLLKMLFLKVTNFPFNWWNHNCLFQHAPVALNFANRLSRKQRTFKKNKNSYILQQYYLLMSIFIIKIFSLYYTITGYLKYSNVLWKLPSFPSLNHLNFCYFIFSLWDDTNVKYYLILSDLKKFFFT